MSQVIIRIFLSPNKTPINKVIKTLHIGWQVFWIVQSINPIIQCEGALKAWRTSAYILNFSGLSIPSWSHLSRNPHRPLINSAVSAVILEMADWGRWYLVASDHWSSGLWRRAQRSPSASSSVEWYPHRVIRGLGSCRTSARRVSSWTVNLIHVRPILVSCEAQSLTWTSRYTLPH